MKHRLDHKTREETEEESLAAGVRAEGEPLSFDLPEVMIRHDAMQTELPSGIGERVMDSLAKEAGQEKKNPWWRRWRPF